MSTTAVKTIPIAAARQSPEAGTTWREPSRCTWRANETKRSSSCSARSRPMKHRPRFIARWATSSSKWANFEEAAKTYRTLTQVKPQYAMGWFNLAVCLERPSAWEDASQAFHKACTLDPKHLDAHLGLGVCHLRQEDPEVRAVHLRTLPGTLARHEDALFGKAAALQSLGHSGRGGEIYEKILARNPDSRRVALEPGPDRHGEGGLRHGARCTRSSCWNCVRNRPWRWKGWPRGRARPASTR